MFTIQNQRTEPQLMFFSTSQRYEYELTKDGTGIIERYSDDKMFYQVIKKIALYPKEKLSFNITLYGLEKGNYHLTIWPTAKGTDDLKVIKTFTIN